MPPEMTNSGRDCLHFIYKILMIQNLIFNKISDQEYVDGMKKQLAYKIVRNFQRVYAIIDRFYLN
jgi:hypothetical protein